MSLSFVRGAGEGGMDIITDVVAWELEGGMISTGFQGVETLPCAMIYDNIR